MQAHVRAIGIVGPGLPDWERARPRLAGAEAYEAEPLPRLRSPLLPSAEARRATALVHLALCPSGQVLTDAASVAADLPSVFASADGDLGILERTCVSLTEAEPWISPHSFHNSVHNAPSGYWSIAAACTGPSTTLSAGNDSFAVGLLEAVLLTNSDPAGACLLVAYDQASPASLAAARPVEHGFACALLLERAPSGAGLDVRPGPPAASSGCDTPALESLRMGNPAARALPLLEALARGESRTLHFAYPTGTLQVGLKKPA